MSSDNFAAFFETVLTVALAVGALIFGAYAITHSDWYVLGRGKQMPMKALRLPGEWWIRVCFGVPAAFLAPAFVCSTLGLVGPVHGDLRSHWASNLGLAYFSSYREVLALFSSYSLISLIVLLILPILFFLRVHKARRLLEELYRAGLWGERP